MAALKSDKFACFILSQMNKLCIRFATLLFLYISGYLDSDNAGKVRHAEAWMYVRSDFIHIEYFYYILH